VSTLSQGSERDKDYFPVRAQLSLNLQKEAPPPSQKEPQSSTVKFLTRRNEHLNLSFLCGYGKELRDIYQQKQNFSRQRGFSGEFALSLGLFHGGYNEQHGPNLFISTFKGIIYPL